MKRVMLTIIVIFTAAAVFAAPGSFAGLKAEDINGNSVSGEVFADNKVTMVNCFTTWCRYCIREMPDLQKLSQQLPGGTGLISICCDAYEAPETLAKIVSKYGITFPVLKFTPEALNKIYELRAYPTTLFIDGAGNIIDVIEGAPRKALETYRDYLKYYSAQ